MTISIEQLVEEQDKVNVVFEKDGKFHGLLKLIFHTNQYNGAQQ